MGLTAKSTGAAAVDGGLIIKKRSDADRVIAVAGNPNVGKSTLFNALTGMHQHTGNWPGKTVACAQGYCKTDENSLVLVDIPGTYSLMAHSAEEEVARDFICMGGAEATVVVCDASCPERGLNLALQVMELCPNTVVCFNLMDEAKRRRVSLDLGALSAELGVPVIGTTAHRKKTLRELTETLDDIFAKRITPKPRRLRYIRPIEDALALLEPAVKSSFGEVISPRWLALRLMEHDERLIEELSGFFGRNMYDDTIVSEALTKAQLLLLEHGITAEILKDRIVSCIMLNVEEVCDGAVCYGRECCCSERKADRIFTGRALGFPIMLALLLVVFWLTIVGANYPSQWLSFGFGWLEERLNELFAYLNAPEWLHGIVIDGAWRVLTWVVSVMLPPMAVFFPLFTLLEDSGYLPRVAYNLDMPFKKCGACGNQALTMMMGFGCNAAGIIGCRIIDSKRERLIAMLTNSLVPCNGRFPMIITLLTIFFIGAQGGLCDSLLSAALLTAVILLGIGMTFIISRILSLTILKGEPSSFTLELPPFRAPQFGKVIVRSIFDRTIFVLGRAAAVAAPAGVVIWLLANITVDGASLLSYATEFLDPLGRALGMDGVILMAFILGIPANEIVVPLIIMCYMAQGTLTELSITQIGELFTANGWTWVTAVCTILFALMHWPCSTSLLTVKKETGSLKWAAAAFVIPTAAGCAVCFVFASVMRLLGI